MAKRGTFRASWFQRPIDMSRLYGITGNEPARVDCSLVDAQNALLRQSEQDARGIPNPDGWGVGSYDIGVPTTWKRERAAHRDTEYRETVEKIESRTVIAHVTAATVGSATLGNTHPFACGPWLFAHNGTLTGFDQLRTALETEIPDTLLE